MLAGRRKKLSIRYFAILKEERGLTAETVESGAETAADLYEELVERHGLSLDRHRLGVAVNNAMTDWQAVLRDGDLVVFIPPVAGG